MSMLNLIKQYVSRTNHKFLVCQNCYKLNLNSFSQFKSHLKLPYQTFKSNLTKPISFINPRTNARLITSKKPDTNVVKDIVLYHYINKRRSQVVLVFGISQSIFWTFTAYTLVTELRNVPVTDPTGKGFFQKHNFGEDKWKYSLGLVSALLAVVSIGMAFVYLTRLVTKIKLDKSGKTLILSLAEDRFWRKTLTVPIKDVSAYYSQFETRSYFPFQIRGSKIVYLVDMEGKINNQALFDVTIGTKRNIEQ